MDQLDVFAPILAKGRSDDGVLWVEGKITGPDLDGDMQRMDPAWLKTAVPEWAKIGNVREAHDARRPVGKAVEVWDSPDGSWYMRAKIVDKAAAEKVEHGVYTGFSIGVKGATVVKTQEAPMGLIGGSGRIVETSLADRPCLPSALLTFAKAEGVGELQPLDTPVSIELTKAEQLSAAAGLLAQRYTTKADDATADIAGARAAIAAITPLIQSEVDGLTDGDQGEQYDVSLLLTALSALTSFLASEVAESQGDDEMDAAAKAEIAELVKTELAEQLAAHKGELVADLTKALTPEPLEPAQAVTGEPILKAEDIAKTVSDAVVEALKPITDGLAAVTTKVDSIPVGGGPAITRTAPDPGTGATSQKQDLIDYANRPGLDPDIRERTLAKAAQLT